MKPPEYVNRTHYRVLYGDIDSMGVMYYANYLRLFERGRNEFIRDRGMTYKEMEAKGLLLPVTESHCHYHKSAEYDDLLLLETRISQVRRASMRFEYEIFRNDGRDEKIVEGYTLHACVSPEKKVIRVPEFIVNLFS